MLDPVVHAALVTIAFGLVRILAFYLKVDLEEDVYWRIAASIVSYILSLFGYALWVKATVKVAVLSANRWYKPPFTN